MYQSALTVEANLLSRHPLLSCDFDFQSGFGDEGGFGNSRSPVDSIGQTTPDAEQRVPRGRLHPAFKQVSYGKAA